MARNWWDEIALNQRRSAAARRARWGVKVKIQSLVQKDGDFLVSWKGEVGVVGVHDSRTMRTM